MLEGMYKIKDLLSHNIVFEVPSYQRNYSWLPEKQVKDFYEDYSNLDEKKEYFLGTIILMEAGTASTAYNLHQFDKLEIIDGQQRLVTLSIFMRVVIDRINTFLRIRVDDDPGFRVQLNGLVEDRKAAFLSKFGFPRLNLLGDDRDFFKNSILDGQQFTPREMTVSIQRMKDAHQYFERKINKLNLEDCLKLISKIDNSKIIIYPVQSREDAVVIFETVNDRGKPLTKLEKIKSFLMSCLYIAASNSGKEDIDEKILAVQHEFGNIFRNFEKISKKFNSLFEEDDILKFHYLLWDKTCQGRYSEGPKFYENIKDIFRKRAKESPDKAIEEIVGYAKDLAKAFEIYKKVYVDLYLENKTGEALLIDKLNFLDRYSNFLPLILAYGYSVILRSDQDFLSFLQTLENFVFRVYAIGDRRSDNGRDKLYTLAHQLYHLKLSLNQVLVEVRELSERIVNKEMFESNLKTQIFVNEYNDKEIKYILYHYEMSLRDQMESYEELNELLLGPNWTMEYILNPDMPTVKRPSSIKRDTIWNGYVYKLGNITFSSKLFSATLGHKPFEEKRLSEKDVKVDLPTAYLGYSKSPLYSQRELAKLETFELNDLIEREKKIISFLIKKWEIN